MSKNGLSAAVIAGVYEHPTRWAPDKTQFQIHAESARGALEDAGLTIADVDGFFTAGVGPIGIMTLAEHLNLNPRHHDSTNIGGSSFVAHVLHADDHTHRRRDADGRGAADAEGTDRLPDLLDGAAVLVDGLGGQQRLVDQADETVHVADPLDGARGVHRIICR